MNIKTDRPAKKLDGKQLGPWKIVAKHGYSSYELDLPDDMRIDNVFHANLLRYDPDNPLPNQIVLPKPPIFIDGQAHYELDEISDAKIRYGGLWFKAKWTNGLPDTNWYKAELFESAPDAIADFYERYPGAPRVVLQQHVVRDPTPPPQKRGRGRPRKEQT